MEGIVMIYRSNQQLKAVIIELFRSNDLSQKYISEKLGISPQALSQKLSKKKNISFDDVAQICEIMGYKLSFDFVRIEDDESEEDLFAKKILDMDVGYMISLLIRKQIEEENRHSNFNYKDSEQENIEKARELIEKLDDIREN